jgi:catechol 2,3-dioxygenase-like lactoylglutathione lyase family enzyme
MAQVKGIGGVFFKSKDPAKLQAWYQENLGLPNTPSGVNFEWDKVDGVEEKMTIWCPFPDDTTYFNPTNPTSSSFMINYIVDDLDGMLAQLRAKGVQVDDKVEDYDYGRFGWAVDPEGNRFELWQSKK